jgi:hypothetical protein
MADKVDVLAVLDEVLRRTEAAMPTPLDLPGESRMCPEHHAGYAHDIREARAAVAALIEVADKAKWGLFVGCDVAWALADLQRRGIYTPRCGDGKPSRAHAGKDLQTIQDAYVALKDALARIGAE